MSPKPFTILTGFLGSGKTSILNALLCNTDGIRIGVLVNEFGAVGIDSQMLKKGASSEMAMGNSVDTLELANGCVCCTTNADLQLALHKMLKFKDTIDHIVLETSGVSPPEPLVATLSLPEFSSDLWLSMVVTVVDAEYFLEETEFSHAARSQLLYADLVLLNKIDLIMPDRIEELKTKLLKKTREDSSPHIIPTQRQRHSQLIQALMGQTEIDVPLKGKEPVRLDKPSGENLVEVDGRENSSDEPCESDHHHHPQDHTAEDCTGGEGCNHHEGHQHHHSHDHSHSRGGHLAEDNFVSTSFCTDHYLLLAPFQVFMRCVLPSGVIRAKGFVHFLGQEHVRTEVQLSGRRRFYFQEHPCLSADDDTEKEPLIKLVFIGRNIDIAKIQEGMKACCSYDAVIPKELSTPDAFDRLEELRKQLRKDQRFREEGMEERVPSWSTVLRLHLVGAEMLGVEGDAITTRLTSHLNQDGRVFVTPGSTKEGRKVLQFDASDPVPVHVFLDAIDKAAQEVLTLVYFETFCCGMP